MMEQWYALHTRPHQEGKVARRLAELEIETLLPLARRAGRAGVRRPAAYFPCYLFVHLDLARVPAAQWQWTPGLRRIVAFGGAPAVIPPAVIGLIRDKTARLNDPDAPALSRFKPGDPVRVTRGPLADMVALFECECAPAERVYVLLNFLGHACRTRVDAVDLEPAARGPLPVESRPPRRTRGHGRYIGTHTRPD